MQPAVLMRKVQALKALYVFFVLKARGGRYWD